MPDLVGLLPAGNPAQRTAPAAVYPEILSLWERPDPTSESTVAGVTARVAAVGEVRPPH